MRASRWSELVVATLASAGAVALVSALIAAVKPYVPVLSLGVLYVFAVLPVAVVWGIGFATAVSIASMLAFNWFFLPPTHTFSLRETENWFALAVYLVTAVVVSVLAARARRRAGEAEQRERETRLLEEISRTLLRGGRIEAELGWIAERCAGILGVGITAIELGVGPRGQPGEYELRTDGRLVGTLAVPSEEDVRPAVRERFLASLASLLAVAVDRERLAQEALEAEALRRSDAVKTAVLRAVSHDLRSPLTAITAAAGGLSRTALELDESDRRELVETIEQEARRLRRMVENLLDLSRLEAGAAAPHAEIWPVDELVASALDELGEERRVEVAVPEALPPVRVDAVQIERVLVNLLENALKFAEPGTPVRLEASLGAEGEVVLAVSDIGTGLVADEVESVFAPFARGAGAGASGSGLGLAIARGFAEANGGRVWGERTERGARFSLALPAQLPAGAPR